VRAHVQSCLVDEWSKTAPDEDRAWVREKVRVSTITRRAAKKKQSDEQPAQAAERARCAYDRLEPKDVVLKHAWLFKSQWIEVSADELSNEDLDILERDKRITTDRVEALRVVVAERGVEGVLTLAAMGNAPGLVGSLLPRVLGSLAEQVDAIRILLAHGPLPESHTRQSVVFGLLGSLQDDDLVQVLNALTFKRNPAEVIALLLLAPFRRATWRLAESLGCEIETAYWNEVHPVWGGHQEGDLGFAVDRLLASDRPRAAFQFADLRLEQLQPKQLFRLLRSIATGSAEAVGTYQLQQHELREAFKVLNQSGEIAVDEMADLEFTYLGILGSVSI
jgi:hypothetical protein